MLTSVVIFSRHPHISTPFRHRDEKPVTASPLESALTNRDVRKPFRPLVPSRVFCAKNPLLRKLPGVVSLSLHFFFSAHFPAHNVHLQVPCFLFATYSSKFRIPQLLCLPLLRK